jgi:hypothetical protein
VFDVRFMSSPVAWYQIRSIPLPAPRFARTGCTAHGVAKMTHPITCPGADQHACDKAGRPPPCAPPCFAFPRDSLAMGHRAQARCVIGTTRLHAGANTGNLCHGLALDDQVSITRPDALRTATSMRPMRKL